MSPWMRTLFPSVRRRVGLAFVQRRFLRDVLPWLDQYLGPVN